MKKRITVIKDIFKIEKKFSFIYTCFVLSLVIYILIFFVGTFPDFINIGEKKDSILVPIEYIQHFIFILPGPFITDLILLYIFPIFVLLIFLKWAPNILLGFVKIHKFIYIGRKKPRYAMMILGNKRSIGTLAKRSWTIGFLSFTISAFLVNISDSIASLFRYNIITDPTIYPLNIAEAMFLGTFFFVPIAFLIALPIWMLEDCGIIYYRKFPKEVLKTPVLKGTHSLFEHVLEYFTGISTLLLLINIITRCFVVLDPGDVSYLTPLILIVLPLFVTGLIAFALIIYEQLLSVSSKKVQKRFIEKKYIFITAPELEDLKS